MSFYCDSSYDCFDDEYCDSWGYCQEYSTSYSDTSYSSSSYSSSSSSSLGGGAMLGVIGGPSLFCVILVICLCCCCGRCRGGGSTNTNFN